MNVQQQLDHDHADLMALGEDVLGSATGPDVGGRDNQFDLYDIQLRRHLAVIEDVLFPPIKKDAGRAGTVDDIQAQHKELRAALSSLDRKDKGTSEWTGDFRNLTDSFDRAAERHRGLVQQTEASGATDLDTAYQRAKMKRLQGSWSWNKVGIGAAAAVAGLAGAAFAANRYYRSGRRAAGRYSGSDGDDFELRLETDENLRLIASSKVEGTAVVGRDGETLGKIESFMVDKYSGRVAYAVMRFGGIAGFGGSLFPLPWPLLDYDEAKDGYALDISKEDLATAPRFEAETEPDWTPEFRRTILFFYRPADAGAQTGQNGRQEKRTDTGYAASAGGGGSAIGGAAAKPSSGSSATNTSGAAGPTPANQGRKEPQRTS